jgi:hypothetical protein
VPRGPLLYQRPAKALDILLAIYYAYIIGYKWRTSVRPVPPAFYVAALRLLSLPYLTSITDIYVLRALHRMRVQLPVRHLQQLYISELYSSSPLGHFIHISITTPVVSAERWLHK